MAEAVNAGRSVEVDGFTLEPEEVNLQAVEKEGLSVASEGEYAVAVPTTVSAEASEGGDGSGNWCTGCRRCGGRRASRLWTR